MAFGCDAELTAPERYVLVAFADNADDNGKCWPKKTTIVDKTGLGRSTVYRAIERLAELGIYSEGTDADGRTCIWLRLSHSGTVTGPEAELAARGSESRSGTKDSHSGKTASRSGTRSSHSGTPIYRRTVKEPSGNPDPPTPRKRGARKSKKTEAVEVVL
jgi:hypothetical protein